MDKDDNELITLEVIHQFVEVLDRYFGNVCELDLIFNFHKVVTTPPNSTSTLNPIILISKSQPLNPKTQTLQACYVLTPRSPNSEP